MSVSWYRSVNLPLACCAALAAIPVIAWGGSYALRVLALAGIYALVTIGYQFIFGHAGALALSQGAFMGLGAYASGILELRYGVAFDASLPVSIGLPVLLATVMGLTVLRLNSHYFALATLLIAQIVLLVAIEFVSLTGGANGIGGVGGITLLGRDIAPGVPTLAVVWSAVGLGGLVAWHLGRGLLFHAYALLRANLAAAQSIGLDAGWLRLIAFLASAGFAGLGGALYVHTVRVISPEVLELPIMVTCLTIAVVGGNRRIAGAVAAALLIVGLPEVFRFLRQYYLVAYGVILLAVIILAPDGLVAALGRLWQRIVGRPVAPLPGSVPLLSDRAPPRALAGEALLELSGIAKRFGGVRALDGVSFAVKQGEILGLIGPNGSGKTTLANVIAGFYRPDGGRILLAGDDIGSLPPHAIARHGIGRTFQTVALVDDMTALDNVALARAGGRHGLGRLLTASLDARSTRRARGEAMDLLERLGVAAIAQQNCGALGPGLKRRVELARALAIEPLLLVLDEPAAGLDPAEQADLARRLRLLASGRALLVIEHNLPFLASLVDRLVCLDGGRVIAEGSPASVQQNPLVVQAYLGGPASAR